MSAIVLPSRSRLPRPPACAIVWLAALSLAALASLLLRPGAAVAQNLPDGFADRLVAGGFDFPVGMAWLPDLRRLLVVEQKSARLSMLIDGAPAATDPLATIDNVRPTGPEQGLLGIAVDPGWPARPYVYIHCDNTGSATIRVSRYAVTGDLYFGGTGELAIDPASRFDLFNDAPDIASNHNGGTLRFGNDGMLYVSLGEDAGGCAAQVLDLRGVILRLDVSRLPAGPGGPPPRALIAAPGNPFTEAVPDSNALLVWAYGLRNPFRFQIDPATGELFIGDVGQNAFEEIDQADRGGMNFGWSRWEGPASFDLNCSAPGAVFPIASYDRSGFTAAVISAGVYRPPRTGTNTFPTEYTGDVFFNDYYQGFLRRIRFDGSVWAPAPIAPGQPNADDWATGYVAASDWAPGADGGMWYVRQAVGGQPGSGQIRRIIYNALPDTTPVDTLPRTVIFSRPFPIPARGAVNLSYTLTQTSRVSVRVFDGLGALVRTVVPERVQGQGIYDLVWNGDDDDDQPVHPGVYFVRLVVGDRSYRYTVPMLRGGGTLR